MHKWFRSNTVVWCGVFGLGLGIMLSGLACGGATTTTSAGSSEGDGLIADPISFGGEVSGTLNDSVSTSDSLGSSQAGQALPPQFETADTSVIFTDLNGEPLRDPTGTPIEEVGVETDGSFRAEGLPVGVDFVLCGDIGRNGECDLETIIHIPADETGERGKLENVRADPLTKIVLAKLRRLIEENGFDIEDLPISPTAVAARIISAYEHLFDDAGIEHTMTLADLEALTGDQLVEFFDSALPPAAQVGMDIVEGNLGLAAAQDVSAVALAAAEVFLRAGFPVADFPGGPDFSSLANLDGIKIVTKDELFGFDDAFGEFEEGAIADILDIFGGEIPPEILAAFPDGIPEDITQEEINALLQGGALDGLTIDDLALIDQAAQALDPVEPNGGEFLKGVFYVSETAEPDRNFSNAEFEGEGGGQLPVFNDHILAEMAAMHLNGRLISLGALHDLLTNLEDGLGARLTYFVHDPNFFGPPLTVFETADGRGKAIQMERLFRAIFEGGFQDLDESTFDSRENELRMILQDILGDTVAPSFERMFDGFIADRVTGAEALATRIREAKAHLPFNHSGPRSFFVVGNGDPFNNPAAAAVTVDAAVMADGTVTAVSYNPDGNGKFFLSFTERTEENGLVGLIVRETGRMLHGARGGPVRLDMYDEGLFGPANGMPFAQMVSDTGAFYPGVSVPINIQFFTPDGTTESFDDRIFVLATGIGEFSEPVRVDYDGLTGLATYNPNGRHLLSFLPDSHETGFFALFNEDTGREANLDDPMDFFEAPLDVPEDFENFFNEPETFQDFEDFDSLDEFVDSVFEDPNLEEPVTDGTIDPLENPDGTTNPDEGTTTDVDTQTDTTTDPITPAEFLGEIDPNLIVVHVLDIQGLVLAGEVFTHVFGVEVANPRHNAAADPFFDDQNANGIWDDGEPTASFRPTLFDARDWRSTDIQQYYRRADNGGPVDFEEVDWEAPTPTLIGGVALVARDYRPRANAFRFGRPNTAFNLLTAFSPPELFDGTHGFNRETLVDVFSAVGVINLVMDQVFNVRADVDIDGLGPLPSRTMLVEARMFVAPLNDPFIMLIKGFRSRVQGGTQVQDPQ